MITATDKTRFVCPSTPIPIVYLYAITEKINNKTTIINENDSEMKKWNDWKQESLHLKAPEAIQFVQNLSFPLSVKVCYFSTQKHSKVTNLLIKHTKNILMLEEISQVFHLHIFTFLETKTKSKCLNK